MRKFLTVAALAIVAGAATFWLVTAPRTLAAGDLPDHRGDPANGRTIFFAAGCASCHAAPGTKGEAKLTLSGGLAMKTPFGTFHVPNISPDPAHGIGAWSDLDFVNAVMRGVSPGGRHYYPAFPYLSYQRMGVTDVLDLKAFIDTLPATANDAPAHDLPPHLRWRRLLGGWKFLFMDNRPFVPIPGASAQVNRGAYLVTGPGHCGECHTPRNALGAPKEELALSGAPNPESRNPFPNITPHADGIGSWSEDDIAAALKTGLLPDLETFGGAMIAVQENLAELTDVDRAAIAAYLKAVPPNPTPGKAR
ncbi:MAG TPA: cytochrome c [Thermohalobaculum sp.]|nr:cytochrome c [Thermohalobaculum sp.]